MIYRQVDNLYSSTDNSSAKSLHYDISTQKLLKTIYNIEKFNYKKTGFHECRALECLLEKVFEFPKGLSLPHTTKDTIQKKSATVAKTTFVIICPW